MIITIFQEMNLRAKKQETNQETQEIAPFIKEKSVLLTKRMIKLESFRIISQHFKLRVPKLDISIGQLMVDQNLIIAFPT